MPAKKKSAAAAVEQPKPSKLERVYALLDEAAYELKTLVLEYQPTHEARMVRKFRNAQHAAEATRAHVKNLQAVKPDKFIKDSNG